VGVLGSTGLAHDSYPCGPGAPQSGTERTNAPAATASATGSSTITMEHTETAVAITLGRGGGDAGGGGTIVRPSSLPPHGHENPAGT